MAPFCKYLTACLLLFSILLQTFSKAVICVDFYANQDYIAKTLCENRDKPMLHCCGRCQLRKRLANDADQDKGNPSRKSNEVATPLFREDYKIPHLTPLAASLPDYGPVLSDRTVVDRASFCFHPPD